MQRFRHTHLTRAVRCGFHNHQWRKTEMIRSLLAVAVVAIGLGTLAAQTDPIATRKALMKANGDQARIANEMTQGKRPFDLDAGKKACDTYTEADEIATYLF